MFSSEDRDQIRSALVEMAGADPRIVAAAAVGSSASGGDRWSDLDLTFGVADAVPVEKVLTDWTETVVSTFGAVVLFDLPHDSVIYRVFLLPGILQVDLSFAPASEFGALGPRFQLLFGEALERPLTPPSSPDNVFGLGVHHIVRARICVERGRLWQAEYWIHEARDQALTLACLRRGLQSTYGRGFDDLPQEVRDRMSNALVQSLAVSELRRALEVVASGLLEEGNGVADGAPGVLRILEGVEQPAPG